VLSGSRASISDMYLLHQIPAWRARLIPLGSIPLGSMAWYATFRGKSLCHRYFQGSVRNVARAHSTTTGVTLTLLSSTPHPSHTMSFLIQGLAALSAFQPKPPTLEYDGLEYRWKMLTFRPAEYKLEAALFAAVGIYLLFYFLGRTYNMSRARHM